MKECFKCLQTKPLSQFYRHKRMADGRLGKCKDCTKKDVNKHRAENLERLRAYDRRRSSLPKRIKDRKQRAERVKRDPHLRKRHNEMKQRWIARNTIKRAAHIMTREALRIGQLNKQPCEVCGKRKAEAHHDDYSQPLSVRWLCHKHHMEHHKNERERMRQANLKAA